MSEIQPFNETDESLPLVRIRPQARADLKEAFFFIVAQNSEKGLSFLEDARATLENLAAMPLMGSPRFFRSGRLTNIRQWPIKNFRKHLIFYRPLDNQKGIEVIRVLRATRDLETLLGESAEN